MPRTRSAPTPRRPARRARPPGTRAARRRCRRRRTTAPPPRSTTRPSCRRRRRARAATGRGGIRRRGRRAAAAGSRPRASAQALGRRVQERRGGIAAPHRPRTAPECVREREQGQRRRRRGGEGHDVVRSRPQERAHRREGVRPRCGRPPHDARRAGAARGQGRPGRGIPLVDPGCHPLHARALVGAPARIGDQHGVAGFAVAAMRSTSRPSSPSRTTITPRRPRASPPVASTRGGTRGGTPARARRRRRSRVRP